MRKTYFSILYLFIILLLIRIFTWIFVWYFATLLESIMQKMKKTFPCTLICANFSFIWAPKPAGRVDPSRFEGLKHHLVGSQTENSTVSVLFVSRNACVCVEGDAALFFFSFLSGYPQRWGKSFAIEIKRELSLSKIAAFIHKPCFRGRGTG